MTEKERQVAVSRAEVKIQETRVRDARTALDQGYLKLKAEFDEAYAILKSDLEREQLKLDKEKAYLEEAEAELARGFSE